MKKLISIFLTIIICTNCQTIKHNPVNSGNDTDIPFNKTTLLQDIDKTETFFFGNREITIYNPYKNKGILALKGSMHNHSSNSSDSLLADPYKTAEKFRDEGGYDFYTFTDHNFTTFNPEVPGIIWMGNAVEVTRKAYHLNVYNLPQGYVYKDPGGGIQKLIDHFVSLGGIVSYNHPSAGFGHQDFFVKRVRNVDFIEIVNLIGGASDKYLDVLLKRDMQINQMPVFGIAVDDYHFRDNMSDPDKYFNKGYIICFADKKDKQDIWKALLSGCFYAVSGNARMNIEFNEGTISVSDITDNAEDPENNTLIEFIGLNKKRKPIVLYSVNDKNASYPINGNEGYVRVRMTNDTGVAYSQAFVIK